ncbi:C2H2 finger domain protein [Aspergillus affinis]|uniref:C2H2 finger domain protein n=1 Tax=Aspergillus affinis TaxID=1070780 RepID=UPI0022FDE5E6|nr:C2H2 finger domain protein [Aspergillus affinis]KAI9038585.1 C2H2 finger domain protein [Aspergillus affinis]
MAAKKSSGTTTTMRRSSPTTEIPLPITYTPTTHRISKAKKGKRVHACEYPGCNKVFTRAEHRRRHELNHNPEALFRCTHHNCKKAFHRPDLLARHMERHELEAQMDNTQWERHSRAPMVSDAHYVPKCAPIDPSAGSYLAVTQQPNSMSIGSLVGPAIHPDLTGDCGMMWNGMSLHSEHQTPLFPGNHIHESVEDTRFYGSPETCSSPSSDGATLSIPSHPRSSLSTTPVVVDPYPENIIESDLSSSPMSMPANVRCWDQHDAGLHSSNLVPLSLHDSLVQPPLQCHYPSPAWSAPHHLGYEEHALPPVTHYASPVGWKSWAI